MRLPALALMLAMGCGREPRVWHGDESFAEAERAEIQLGNEWIADRLGVTPFDVRWDLPHPTSLDVPSYSIVRGPLLIPCGAVGYAKGHTVALRVDVKSLAALAAHEFAHEHGLGHHEEDGLAGLMNKGGDALEWTKNDVAVCRKVLWSCED